MRWITTIVLSLFLAAGVVWLLLGERVRRTIGMAPAVEVPSTSRVKLQDAGEAAALTGIKRGDLELLRVQGEWEQPSQWPVRQKEANELAAALTDLKTRYQPIAISKDDEANLMRYGLAAVQNPVTVSVTTRGKTLTMEFGQGTLTEGDTSFGRPTYLRIDKDAEVLRLGPDVYAAVNQPAESYRRRQLFPHVVRYDFPSVAIPNPMAPPPTPIKLALPSDRVREVRISTAGGGFNLRRTAATPGPVEDPLKPGVDPANTSDRIASVWEIAAVQDSGGTTSRPQRDRVEPAKLRSLLAAVPELWAERFVNNLPDDETGLKAPERSLQIVYEDGSAATLHIGKLAREGTGAKSGEKYYYARLEKDTQLIEIRGDRFADVFGSRDGKRYPEQGLRIRGLRLAVAVPALVEEFRDANVARFATADVQSVDVTWQGQSFKLAKTPGDPNATDDDLKTDRWYSADRRADPKKVQDLLAALNGLKTTALGERYFRNDAALLTNTRLNPAADRMVVTTANKVDGPRTHEFRFGVPRPILDLKLTLPGGPRLNLVPAAVARRLVPADARDHLHVQVAGWPRVSRMPLAAFAVRNQTTAAYRSPLLFDAAKSQLAALQAEPRDSEAYAIKLDGLRIWQFEKPVTLTPEADATRSAVEALGKLEASNYRDEALTETDLVAYGLDKPLTRLTMRFQNGPVQTLEIGNPLPVVPAPAIPGQPPPPAPKPDYTARLTAYPGVFTLPSASVEAITASAASLLPKQLWKVEAGKLRTIQIDSPAGTNAIVQAGAEWNLRGRIDAPLGTLAGQPLLPLLSTLQTPLYEAIQSDPASPIDAALYGFPRRPVRVSITYDGAANERVTKTLVLGGPNPELPGSRFARLEGESPVFNVSEFVYREATRPLMSRLDRNLLALDRNRIQQISLSGPAGAQLELVPAVDRKTWTMNAKPFSTDPAAIEELLALLEKLTAEKIEAYGTRPDLKALGLEAPKGTVTVKLADGHTETILLGQPVNDGPWYARVSNGPAVAVVSKATAETLNRGTLDYVSRTLLSFEPRAIKALNRQHGTEMVEFTFKYNPDTDVEIWTMTRPTVGKADRVVLGSLRDELANLRATRIVAYEPARLSDYGLKSPYATITMVDNAGTSQLKLGDEGDDGLTGDRYATLDDKTVGVLPGALVARLMAPPIRYRDRALATFADADRATLTRGDRTVAFAKVSGTWKLEQPFAGEAEHTDLQALHDTVAKLNADELVAEKPADLAAYGLDSPQAVWTFLNGETQVLKLAVGMLEPASRRVPVPERVYAQLVGTDTVVLLEKTLSAKLLGEYRRRRVWPGLEAATVDVIAVTDGKANFVFRRQGPNWSDAANPQDILEAFLVNDLLEALAGLNANSYVADDNADLKLYGLDAPERVITLTTRAGPKALNVGKADAAGRYYARLADAKHSDVFLLSASDSARILKSRTAYVVK